MHYTDMLIFGYPTVQFTLEVSRMISRKPNISADPRMNTISETVH